MIKILGIKNCDTVKKAIKWLDQQGVEHIFHDFRRDGLSEELALEMIHAVDTSLLINKRGTTWRKLDEPTKALIDQGCQDVMLQIMLDEPAVIKRPVWRVGEGYQVGFTEAVQKSVIASL